MIDNWDCADAIALNSMLATFPMGESNVLELDSILYLYHICVGYDAAGPMVFCVHVARIERQLFTAET